MCGISGYFSRSSHPAASQVMLALYAQQHRGQESCGIAVSDGAQLRLHREMGYVKEAFSNQTLQALSGFAAIGHVRYPTRGASEICNTQPYIIETLSGPIYAIASNGDIVNYDEIVDELRVKGVHFSSKNDGELLGRFIVYHHEREGLEIVDAIKLLMKRVKGAYSSVFLTRDALYAFRDVHGFRPMMLGRVGEDVAIASESCALDILRCDEMREMTPGEIVVLTQHSERSIDLTEQPLLGSHTPQPRHCVFELIYFARPDSSQFDEYVYEVRHKIGAKLASRDDFDADVVVPVPDSANFIAMGYANAKNLPMHLALIRNHYVGRTFIRPDQHTRDESVRQKFNPLKDFFNGKRVVLVDDSIVRGTTVRKLVRMVKGAGAKEVHLRIGSPPVRYSCYYGIDTPTRSELIANRMSIEDICTYLNADSLNYLTIEDLGECVRDSSRYCYACFDGNYPVPNDTPHRQTASETDNQQSSSG